MKIQATDWGKICKSYMITDISRIYKELLKIIR